MKAYFYDIESLANVFTLCNFRPGDENSCDIFYLCDDPALTAEPDMAEKLLRAVHEANRNFDGGLKLYDLHDQASVAYLTALFGMSDSVLVNDPALPSSYPAAFRPVCDTDPDYDPDKHPYFMGYNSYNYDTTMLAVLFNESWEPVRAQPGAPGPANTGQVVFHGVTAAYLRQINDILFTDRFKPNMSLFLACSPKFGPNGAVESYGAPSYQDPRWRIRKNMMMSGRQVDVARLNEKLQKVGLKRIIGMLGGQILESDRLRPGVDRLDTPQDFYDLVAYNVSDCVNLKLKVFDHSVYQGQFSLKKKLLEDYPELIYERDMTKTRHVPDIRPEKVRKDRLFIDSSSAQLATKALCPYGHLTDIPAVSFMYPHPDKAKELGITPVNVLEETRKFFYSKFPQPELRAEFDRIYNYFKSIEGRNFNSSRNYQDDYEMLSGNPRGLPAEDVASIPKTDTCLYYYDKDGKPTSCFVTFSIGGLHGAEYNKTLYEHDLAAWEQEYRLFELVRAAYPDPRDLKIAKRVQVEFDGEMLDLPAGQFLKSNSTSKNAAYKDILSRRPCVFKRKNDSDATELNKKYTYTSADPTNHEDFKSYYPNLLRMMAAFYNPGLGYDRYAEIFYQKEDLGVLMKDKNADYAKLRGNKPADIVARYDKLRAASGMHLESDLISDDERAVYAVQREGTKLVLNSASGGADAAFESNIRMNNQIISMRIIGQIFTYRIGQAQTFYGAKVTSTNTDGLFTVMESSRNDAILAQESNDIGVEIEPEPTYLISKDTNNRLEMDVATGNIQAASGGTLACRVWAGKKGPQPTKSLAHPAIIDWALAEYLVFAATDRSGRAGMDLPFNPEVGYNILKSASSKMDEIKLLNMFQNVIASSPSSVSYIFNTEPGRPDVVRNMQHYNRVFILKDNAPGTVHLHMAVSRKLTPPQISKRMANGERPQQHDAVAVEILEANGVAVREIPLGWEASVKKVTNIEDTWFMLVENHDLAYLDKARLDFIMENLDYGKYLYLLGDCFESNWRNKLPGGLPTMPLIPFTQDLDAAMAAFKDGSLMRTAMKTPADPDDSDGDTADGTAKPKRKSRKKKPEKSPKDPEPGKSPVSDPNALPDDGTAEQAPVVNAQDEPNADDPPSDDLPPWDIETGNPQQEPENPEQDGDAGPGTPLTPEQIRNAHRAYVREMLNPYSESGEPMPPDQALGLDEIAASLPPAQKVLSDEIAAAQAEPENNACMQTVLPGFPAENPSETVAAAMRAVRHAAKAAMAALDLAIAQLPADNTEIHNLAAMRNAIDNMISAYETRKQD